jgi:hypothetical protein
MGTMISDSNRVELVAGIPATERTRGSSFSTGGVSATLTPRACESAEAGEVADTSTFPLTTMSRDPTTPRIWVLPRSVEITTFWSGFVPKARAGNLTA